MNGTIDYLKRKEVIFVVKTDRMIMLQYRLSEFVMHNIGSNTGNNTPRCLNNFK